jgi:hypothetical protein
MPEGRPKTRAAPQGPGKQVAPDLQRAYESPPRGEGAGADAGKREPIQVGPEEGHRMSKDLVDDPDDRTYPKAPRATKDARADDDARDRPAREPAPTDANPLSEPEGRSFDGRKRALQARPTRRNRDARRAPGPRMRLSLVIAGFVVLAFAAVVALSGMSLGEGDEPGWAAIALGAVGGFIGPAPRRATRDQLAQNLWPFRSAPATTTRWISFVPS